MDKNIPLSELIRIGCKVTKPCTNAFYTADDTACALEAAYMAKFGEHSKPGTVPQALNVVDTMACNPVDGWVFSLADTIINLVDHKGWTREQVADWLQSIKL